MLLSFIVAYDIFSLLWFDFDVDFGFNFIIMTLLTLVSSNIMYGYTLNNYNYMIFV